MSLMSSNCLMFFFINIALFKLCDNKYLKSKSPYPGRGFWVVSSNLTPFFLVGLAKTSSCLLLMSLFSQSMIVSRISSPLRQLQRASAYVVKTMSWLSLQFCSSVQDGYLSYGSTEADFSLERQKLAMVSAEECGRKLHKYMTLL